MLHLVILLANLVAITIVPEHVYHAEVEFQMIAVLAMLTPVNGPYDRLSCQIRSLPNDVFERYELLSEKNMLILN